MFLTFIRQSLVALGGLQGLLGGVPLVVGASGDDMLAGDMTILNTDNTETEHRVGKTVTDKGECSFGALIR